MNTIRELPPCAKDCFLGIVSTSAIGRVVVAEVSAKTPQPWVVSSLLVASAPGHLLDSFEPVQRALFWSVFSALIVAMLALDLLCALGTARAVQLGSALRWTLGWIAVAMCFAAGVYWQFGRGPALLWLTSYLLEKFLSIDNLFVFLTIFANFKTPARFQHKVHSRNPRPTPCTASVLVLLTASHNNPAMRCADGAGADMGHHRRGGAARPLHLHGRGSC